MMGRPVALADGGGLTFTLSAKGTAAWVLRYRFDGKPRELTTGRYPEITLARARELAMGARAPIQQGADVARDKRRAGIERAAAKSFVDWAGGSGLHRPLGITTLTVTRLSSLPYALPSPGKLAQSAAQSHQLP